MQPDQQIPPTPGQWQFSPEKSQSSNIQPNVSSGQNQDEPVQWTASEFIAYQKNVGWYFVVTFAVLVLAAIVFLLTHDYVSTGSIVSVGVLFMLFAGRKPRVLSYSIGDDGIRIGEKLYAFGSIRSFAVIDEGNFRSISLLPLQRFMPAISMYFEPQDETKIVNTLGNYLPKEERKQDMVDRFMHKIRF